MTTNKKNKKISFNRILLQKEILPVGILEIYIFSIFKEAFEKTYKHNITITIVINIFVKQ